MTDPTGQTAPGQALELRAAVEYSRTLSESSLLPDQFRKQPANLLWAIEYARTLRVPVMTAITGIHVMKGKPTASAALMTALVRRAGHRLHVRYHHDRDDIRKCYAEARLVRADDPDGTDPFESTWDYERAQAAELLEIRQREDGTEYAHSLTEKGKASSWMKFGPSMLKARALSEVCRDGAEECLFGLHYTAEELGAQDVNADGMPYLDSEIVPDPTAEELATIAAALDGADSVDNLINAWGMVSSERMASWPFVWGRERCCLRDIADRNVLEVVDVTEDNETLQQLWRLMRTVSNSAGLTETEEKIKTLILEKVGKKEPAPERQAADAAAGDEPSGTPVTGPPAGGSDTAEAAAQIPDDDAEDVPDGVGLDPAELERTAAAVLAADGTARPVIDGAPDWPETAKPVEGER
jgi:hypothetical protein